MSAKMAAGSATSVPPDQMQPMHTIRFRWDLRGASGVMIAYKNTVQLFIVLLLSARSATSVPPAQIKLMHTSRFRWDMRGASGVMDS
jgi:hypothetical protein